jgi:hypothetical protein
MASAPLMRLAAVVTSVMLAACGGSPPGDVSHGPSPTASSSTGSLPALEGTWATRTIPAAEIREVVLDGGFTRVDAAQVIADTRTFTFELRFEDGGYALHSSWDGEGIGVLEAGGIALPTGIGSCSIPVISATRSCSLSTSMGSLHAEAGP